MRRAQAARSAHRATRADYPSDDRSGPRNRTVAPPDRAVVSALDVSSVRGRSDVASRRRQPWPPRAPGLLPLLAAAALIVRCLQLDRQRRAAAPSGSGSASACAGTGTAGRRQPPDPGGRGRQVQRRDGPHRPARRRRLEPGPLRGPPVPVPEHARHARRLHRDRARGRRLRAGLPEPVAQGLQLHHRHVVRLHGLRWRPSPRSSRTSPTSTSPATSRTARTSATSSAPSRT